MEMLILCRHEHFGHSTPKARKPAAREQGRPEGATLKLSKHLLAHGTDSLSGVQLAGRRCEHLQARGTSAAQARHKRGEEHS